MARSPSSSRKTVPLAKPRPGRAAAGRTAGGGAARPARRAKRDRGADTRAQLIEAGLDVFGRLGFEAAGTRQIAEAAGANLAAIVYHFGSKEGLHLAVAEHIAMSIGARIGPTLAAIGGPDAAATPTAARAALHRLIETFTDVILGAAEAERWARFIVREQMQPTAAFDVIYGFLGGAVSTATRLMAAALGRKEDAEMRISVFTAMGQVLIFRVAQTMIFRRMDWRRIGDDERGLIKRVVLRQIDDILDAEKKP